MKSRIEHLPVYEVRNAAVSARYFNRVLVALKRLGEPLYLPLPDLRDLGIYLDHELWVCYDRSLNDIPVIAWTEFDTAHRSGLHDHATCILRLYHNHAERIIDKVLMTVYDVLDQKFDESGLPRDTGIADLRTRLDKPGRRE